MRGHYWSTGITVWLTGPDDKWAAEVAFYDCGFLDDDSTGGMLRARYVGPLEKVAALVKKDAERLGIKFGSAAGGSATVYYKGDGESTDIYPAPADWKERVSSQALAFGPGWCACYDVAVKEGA